MRFKFYRLIGNARKYSKERRLYHIILIFGIFLSVWSAVTNFLLELDPLLVWTCIASAVLLGWLYYLSKVKQSYTFSITVLIVSILVIIPAVWMSNGGISGSIPFYIILFSTMGSALFAGYRKVAAIGLLLLIATVLMVIDYFYPASIIGYPTAADRYIDVWIGLMTTVVFNSAVFIVTLKHYSAEHERAKKYLAQSRQIQKNLLYLSYHDALTGLYNRAYFEKEINQIQPQSEAGVGVFAVDVDGLKFINDTFGHEQGDLILIRAAKVLTASFRESDVIARIGGDEFVILVRGGGLQDMENMYKRIRRNICCDQQQNAGSGICLQMSVGYACTAGSGKKISDLLREADNKMYREKTYHKTRTKGSMLQMLKKLLAARVYSEDSGDFRLQRLIADFSIAAGIPESEITDVQLFAEFHDVGKISIAADIMNKQGLLSETEKTEIQRHCETGYRIAQSSTDLLPIADWVLKHHEWWNGEGYPLGLKGCRIPLPCRIVAIADAYAAMVNDRPYRKAISHEAALLELQRCAGTQFDPELVKIFIVMSKAHEAYLMQQK